jgi:hypothetical protein
MLLVEILLQEELGGFIVQLRRRAGALLRSQRLSPLGLVEVAFDRREAHAEGAGCLCLGHPASHGRDYLLSEVFGVAIHVVMLSSVHLYRNMLSGVVGELAALKGDANHWLTDPAYATLRHHLEAAYAAAEAALVEARRRVRLNERQGE